MLLQNDHSINLILPGTLFTQQMLKQMLKPPIYFAFYASGVLIFIELFFRVLL